MVKVNSLCVFEIHTVEFLCFSDKG